MPVTSSRHNCLYGRIKLANHETNDSIDRGHDTPEAGGTTAASPDRSTWSRRLEFFDDTGAGPVVGGYKGPVAPPASSETPEDWDEIPSGSTSTSEWVSTSSADNASPDATAWPDPDGLDISLAAARRENADRSAEIAGLRGALGAAHHQLRARETEIADLTTRLSVAKATTQARQGELNALGARCKGVEEKLAATEHELALMRDKLQRSADVAEKRESQIENLRATRTTLEETLKARDRVISARDEELGAHDQELQAVRLRIAALQKTIADRDAEMAMLADQLLTQQERSRALEAEVGGREQVVSNQRSKLAERDDQLASLLATLDVVERTLARRPGVAELGEGDAAQPFESESESISSSSFFDRPDISLERSGESDFGHEATANESAGEPAAVVEEAYSRPVVEDSEASVSEEPVEALDDDATDTLVASGNDASPVLEDEPDTESELAPEQQVEAREAEDGGEVEDVALAEAAAPDEKDEISVADATEAAEDDGVEPGSALSRAFDAELNELATSGDLFNERPPPQTPIFRWWRDQQIQNTEALPVASFDELITNTIARECAARSEETIAVLSICGADPELEVRVGRALLAQGHENFAIDCLDDRDSWHDARADVAETVDLSAKIDSLPAEYESFTSDQKYDVFIADGSLQHAGDLARLFEQIKQVWKDDSVMVVCAALGSSAAGASPEHIESVDRIWNVMSDRYMQNHVTGAQQPHFVASETPSDAAGSGGALAPSSTPLLPMLLDGYFFEVFTVFGNLVNAYLGPEVGPNFDPADESDRSFIERFSQLDEAQIDAGTIHPLHMVAVVRGSSTGETVMIENRAPERCLALGQVADDASE